MFKIPYFTWTLPQHELVKANCAAAGPWRLLIEAALDKLAQVVSFRAPAAAKTSDELLAVMIQGANNGLRRHVRINTTGLLASTGFLLKYP